MDSRPLVAHSVRRSVGTSVRHRPPFQG